MNPYLKRQREQYEQLRSSIEGLQTRAADENRDLTDDELTLVRSQGEQAKTIAAQITELTDIETRNAQVADMAATIATATSGDHTRSGGTTTRDRDPGFYTRGSEHSFFGDQYRAAKMGDTAAQERLTRHSMAMRDHEHFRDVLMSGGGSGLIPPVWLAEQFAPILHRRLRVAALLRQVPFAGPNTWTIPIAGTAATTEVVAEGSNPTETNPTYTTISVTPKAISGMAEVSRQMLEASNPAVDAVIAGDLLGDFYDDAETETITALEAQASVNAVTIADGAVLPGARNGVLDAITAVSDNGGGDPDLFVGRQARWTQYLKLSDTTNRPLIVSQRHNPQNVNGTGDNLGGFRGPVQGELEGLAVATSPTVAANRGFVINSQELLFSVSSPTQFTFEQPAGPALVRVGVWGYMAVVTARRPKAITKITYTAN